MEIWFRNLWSVGLNVIVQGDCIEKKKEKTKDT